jgi:DNA-directed RNA polymerase sigma subunit (sigma70/sigma32)
MYQRIDDNLQKKIKTLKQKHKVEEIAVILGMTYAQVAYRSKIIKRNIELEEHINDFEDLMFILFAN